MAYERESELLRQKQVASDMCAQETSPSPSPNKLYGAELSGARGNDISRRPIRQRIHEALAVAEHAHRRAIAADTARRIIDAHPEFAELLDALNEF